MSQKLTNNQLNAKQERFCIEYLIDFNGTKAAIRSGYSEKTARQMARENLTKPYIRSRIGELTEAAFKDTQTNVNDVLIRLKKIAFVDIKDFMKWDKDGNITLNPSDEVDGELVSEVTKVETNNKDGTNINFKFKLQDKMKGLEMLSKYLGMYVERLEDKKEWTVIVKKFDGYEEQFKQFLKQRDINQT